MKLDWMPIVQTAGAIPEGVAYAVKVAFLRPMLDGITLPDVEVAEQLPPEEIYKRAAAAVYRVEP